MPSPQQMYGAPSQHSGSYESPQERFSNPSQSPRSSPNLLPSGPSSNHDISARYPPSFNSGFQSSNTHPSPARFPLSSNSGFQSSSTPPSQPSQSLSQLSGYHQARRRSFTESNPPPRLDGIQPLSGDMYHPPYKSVKTEGDAMRSQVITYDNIKREVLGSPEKKTCSPTKLPYMKTGCRCKEFRETFKDPLASKKIEDSLDYINFESEHQLETFYTDSLSKGPAVEDEINNTPKLPKVELTDDDWKEVEYYEKMLMKEFCPK